MRKFALFVLVFLASVSVMAKKKQPKTPDPVLCAIKTVFVDGNSSSANIIRSKWQSVTGIAIVNSASVADAILDVSQESHIVTVERYSGLEQRTLYTISLSLKDKTGQQVWTYTGQNDPTYWASISRENDLPDAVDSVMYRFKKDAACGRK
jgi:hypothetical protein